MEVIWDTEKIYVDLPLASMTLGSLKSYLSSKTGVIPDQMRLYYNGGLMREDSTPLSAYHQGELLNDEESDMNSAQNRSSFWSGILGGIKRSKRPLMKIRMIGSAESRGYVIDRPDLENRQVNKETHSSLENLARSTSTSHQPIMNETNSITNIRALTDETILNIKPKVEELEESIKSNEENQSLNPNQLNQFTTLSEMLLQSLLKLDGFEIDVEWNEARSARKESVKIVQTLLDRLDQAKVNQKQK
ncbi:hypothetical protein DFH28DRAFT_969799 [Melampsora americana]|nr:hypothetical protein DFH28DRAFT_969799 [Melampsora americana]